MHPGLDVIEAGGQSGLSFSGDGCSGDVEMDVIGVAVEVETMAATDVANGEHVEDE